jgi:ribosomal protein S26
MSLWDNLLNKDFSKIGTGIMSVLEGSSSTTGANDKPKQNISNPVSQMPMSDTENASISQSYNLPNNKTLYVIGGAVLIGILGLVLIIKK